MRPIVVAGMGRSGTSMVTEALAALGVYLGGPGELTPPSVRNRRGYFENKEAVRINKAIWAKLGGGTMRQPPPDLYEGWWYGNEFAEDSKNAGDLIQTLSNACQSRCFAIKDPRNSITWPFWALAAPDAQFLICLRHPHEVTASLNWKGKRAGLPVLKLWSYFYKALEPLLTAHTDPIHSTLGPVVVTHYERWLADPVGEHRRVAGLLGLDETNATGEVVCPGLRHERATKKLAGAIGRQYAEWCALAQHSPAPPGAVNRDEYRARYLKSWRLAFYRQVAGRVAKLLPDGGRVFEVGSGTGHFAQQVNRAVTRRHSVLLEYRGYDLAEPSIAWARDLALPPALFEVADVYHQLPEGRYHCAVCLQVLEHVYDPTLALKRMKSVLKPGGHLVVSVPNNKRLDSPSHLHRWTLKSFGEFLKRFGVVVGLEPVAGSKIILGIVRVIDE